MAITLSPLKLSSLLQRQFQLTSKSLTTPTKNFSIVRATSKMEGSEVIENEGLIKKKIFVAGATGNTGKRVVDQLLAKGFAVKAGVRDVRKAKASFADNPSLQFVKVDVTEGPEKLAEAIGDDSDAVICATGFRPSLDLFTPWKVSY
ncbi:hypothetical protein GIB67_024093 [Kingdonia uniflora]|uniref:NAD(P)-binding domain-containing protein n=1 Tax=Kingdonia uniflora TaxID=39325 RepID=A0A7J7MML7_9MAGN|nr:hypothetical protein GIB67_024093 [Kingdonia uniflora]